MNHFFSLLLLLAVLQARISNAQTAADSLKSSDSLFSNPFSRNLVTPTAYNRLLYRNVVAIGGLNIKQGHAAGTSFTVDDKGGALTIGIVPFPAAPHVALQGIVRATADNGLVTLFSGGEYQKTLGIGGGGLFFLPYSGTSNYRERTKKNLQWQYQQLRDKDSAAWHHRYQPRMPVTWQNSSNQAICTFVGLWHELQRKTWAKSYYKGDFLHNDTLKWAHDPKAQAFMVRYLKAEHDVLLFLPEDWDTKYPTGQVEGTWLDAKFPDVAACKKGDYTKVASLLRTTWQQQVATQMQRASLMRIDSLQDATRWESFFFHWFSVNVLYNTVQESVFNAAAGKSGFAEPVRDNYWTAQVAYNWLRVGQRNNWYWTAGLSAEHRRNFDPTTLQTYEIISQQHTGIDSVRVVDQKQLYPSDPGQQFALSWLAGLTYYHHAVVNWGISANYSQKEIHSHQSVVTLGVFTPVQAGDASILLMPLVRWDNQGTPHRWTVGISLTTSIPAFARSKAGK